MKSAYLPPRFVLGMSLVLCALLPTPALAPAGEDKGIWRYGDGFAADQEPRESGSLLESLKYYGWVQAGISVNDHDNRNTYEGGAPFSRNQDPLSGNSYILGMAQQSDLKLNQAWVGIAKETDSRFGFDWGFRADFLAGTDARFLACADDQTFDYDWGTGDYYAAFAQLYGEAAYKGLTLRVGKFLSPLSYESPAAPDSFFYSHSYMFYQTPFTHMGVTAEYGFADKLTIMGGWTAGSNGSFKNTLDDDAFLGQIRYEFNPGHSLTFGMYRGWHNGSNKRDDAATKYSRGYWSEAETIMTLRYIRKLSRKWFYMIEGLWNRSELKMPGGANEIVQKSYGVNQHLIYAVNEKWSFGLRYEWHHGEGTFVDIAPITQLPGVQGGRGGDLHAATVAANWDVLPCLNLKAELRHDWSSYRNGFKPFGGQDRRVRNEFQGSKNKQLMASLAATWTF